MTYDFSDVTHLCLSCGAGLTEEWPYALCELCQKTRTCKHEVPFFNTCEACLQEADLAYDASREAKS